MAMRDPSTKARRINAWGTALLNQFPALSRRRRKRQADKKRRQDWHRQRVKMLRETTAMSIGLLLVGVNLIGCASNPFVESYTGPIAEPLPKQASVHVRGYDLDDPRQADAFDAALEAAEQDATPLGVASFITEDTLRDAAVADAARRLGADRVLYTFEYRHASFETHPRGRIGVGTGVGGKTHGTIVLSAPIAHQIRTQHWWLYRAYFFAETTSHEPMADLG